MSISFRKWSHQILERVLSTLWMTPWWQHRTWCCLATSPLPWDGVELGLGLGLWQLSPIKGRIFVFHVQLRTSCFQHGFKQRISHPGSFVSSIAARQCPEALKAATLCTFSPWQRLVPWKATKVIFRNHGKGNIKNVAGREYEWEASLLMASCHPTRTWWPEGVIISGYHCTFAMGLSHRKSWHTEQWASTIM